MPESKRSVDQETIRHFWRASLKYKKELAFSLLIPISVMCMYTLIPLFIGRILAGLGRPGANPSQYLPYLIVTAIVGVVCNRIGFRNLLGYQARTMDDLQTETFTTLLDRSTGFHNNNVSGKLVSDAIEYPVTFINLSNAVYLTVVPFVVIIVTGVSIVMYNSFVLGLILIVMSTVAIGSAFLFSRRRTPLRNKRLVARKAYTAHLADTIVNHQTVKTFANETTEYKTHRKLGERLLHLRLVDWNLVAIDGNYRIAGLLLFQVIFAYVIIKQVQSDPALLAIGIFAFSYTITLVNRLFDINTMIRTIEEGLLDASPMTQIMLQDPEIIDAPNAAKLAVSKGEITFTDVIFTYQDNVSNKEVFSKLTLTIAPGERVGLVGPSGGGKSTLTRLLLRFEDIQDGEILIDKQNIAHVTQASLREQISYVPQEPLLFHRSVRENIAYGRPEATLEQIIESAKLANADEFITELPNAYDTIVGERGVKLSGGQRQRVAIARAILKNAPILILDEATSALDSDNERLIQGALWNLMHDKTAVVIAHRLSTVQKLDRIIVLDNGQILEEGTHQELIGKKGLYAELWGHQSGGFIDE